MHSELMKALIVGIPVSALLAWSGFMARRERSLGARLQLVGAFCCLTVVAAHVGEALDAPSWMGWGRPASPGHYLDLTSAVCAVTFLVGGCALRYWQHRRLTRA